MPDLAEAIVPKAPSRMAPGPIFPSATVQRLCNSCAARRCSGAAQALLRHYGWEAPEGPQVSNPGQTGDNWACCESTDHKPTHELFPLALSKSVRFAIPIAIAIPTTRTLRRRAEGWC